MLNENELKALVSLLDDDDREVLAHVEEQIRAQGEAVIPFLEERWENSFDPIFQKRVEELIHSMQFDVLKSRLVKYKEGGASDLFEGLWLLSTYQYPELSQEKLRQVFEEIYIEAWREFQADLHPIDQIKRLNGAIFGKLRFGPNTRNFHSPANSFLNQVLESRKGNPIALCCVYLMIAQRLEIPVYGVNLPNLFILTYKADEVQFYINAFNRGLVFTRENIDNYVERLNLIQQPEYYEPCDNLTILKRMMRNLINAFEKLSEFEKMEEVRSLLHLIADPDDPRF